MELENVVFFYFEGDTERIAQERGMTPHELVEEMRSMRRRPSTVEKNLSEALSRLGGRELTPYLVVDTDVDVNEDVKVLFRGSTFFALDHTWKNAKFYARLDGETSERSVTVAFNLADLPQYEEIVGVVEEAKRSFVRQIIISLLPYRELDVEKTSSVTLYV